MTALKNIALRPPKAPNLPISPVEYDRNYQDQLTNAMRIYFNEIDNFAQPFGQATGGAYLKFPFIAAVDNAVQYATGANVPTQVQWSSADVNGWVLSASGATAPSPGWYKITYSLQFANTDNTAAHDAIVWLRKNGNDVDNSSTIFTIPAAKSAVIGSYLCGYSEVLFKVAAGDVITLWWGTDVVATSGGAKGNYIYYRAAQTVPPSAMAYPATPSAIGSITFVSALTS